MWPILAEFRHWPQWGPSIRSVEADAVAVASGVSGRVQTVIGLRLPFVITDVGPMRSWDWKVAGIPATGHTASAIGPAKTRVEFSVSAVLIPYALVLRAGLRRLKALAEALSLEDG